MSSTVTFRCSGPVPVSDTEYTTEVKAEELQYATINGYVAILILSSNGNVDSLPEELSNASILVGLDLSYNDLAERIPRNIGHMEPQ